MFWITVLFWSAVGCITYTYLVFPAMLALRAVVCRRAYAARPVTPSISMIIAAHNEADQIGAKLENVLSLDYPADRLEVIVASDGSQDGTNDVVRCFAKRGVRLFELPRQGKAAALNAAAAAARGEILVFSDANSMLDRRALIELVRPLADPTVGGVAGDQRYLRDGSSINSGERAYWSFDRLLKRCESAAGNAISATGALYAVRRSLFRTVPAGVTDDFVTSTAVIAQGYRLVFSSRAVAYEPVASRGAWEFQRKVRVMTRGLRAVWVQRQLLNPLRYGFYSVQLLSHKVIRRLVVIPLLALLATSPWLIEQGVVYRWSFLIQVGLYGGAAAGALFQERAWARHPLVSFPYYFAMANAAAAVALMNILTGRQIPLWQPQRSGAHALSARPAFAVSRAAATHRPGQQSFAASSNNP